MIDLLRPGQEGTHLVDEAAVATLGEWGVADAHALCWVHDARHYKKLVSPRREERTLLETMTRRYWAFYGEQLAYRRAPDRKSVV